jgi:hypothetical protein
MALAAVVLVVLVRATSPSPKQGPREVFAAHIAALAGGDWVLGDSYAHEDCDFGDQAFLDDVLDSGFDFEREFEVDDVWMNEDGTLAIMSLVQAGLVKEDEEESTALPMLELIDGQWVLICTDSWPPA